MKVHPFAAAIRWPIASATLAWTVSCRVSSATDPEKSPRVRRKTLPGRRLAPSNPMENCLPASRMVSARIKGTIGFQHRDGREAEIALTMQTVLGHVVHERCGLTDYFSSECPHHPR